MRRIMPLNIQRGVAFGVAMAFRLSQRVMDVALAEVGE